MPVIRLIVLGLLVDLLWTASTFAAESTSAGNAELFDRLDANQNGAITTDEVTSENRSLFERLLRHGDENRDKMLSKQEFLAALVPTRPERELVGKKAANSSQADAVRYMLLKLDVNQNARLEKDEVPKKQRPIFEIVMKRIDKNNDGQLDLQELSLGGPTLTQIASRYVEREGVNLQVELPKLVQSQGPAADRFEDRGGPQERLADPTQARQLFREMDANNDDSLSEQELSRVFRERADRFAKMADRNRDGRLSQTEFLEEADRVSRFLGRQMKEERKNLKAMKNEQKSKPADLAPSDKK